MGSEFRQWGRSFVRGRDSRHQESVSSGVGGREGHSEAIRRPRESVSSEAIRRPGERVSSHLNVTKRVERGESAPQQRRGRVEVEVGEEDHAQRAAAPKRRELAAAPATWC